MFHQRWLTGLYALGSQYARVLNIPGFSICQVSKCTWVLNILEFWILNMLKFWIYQGSEYASSSQCQGSEYARFTQGPEYVWIIHEFARLCLNMSEYTWICQNMCEYAYICLNGFCLLVLIVILCLLECMVAYFNKVHHLKEHEVVFLKRQNLIFSIVAGIYLNNFGVW